MQIQQRPHQAAARSTNFVKCLLPFPFYHPPFPHWICKGGEMFLQMFLRIYIMQKGISQQHLHKYIASRWNPTTYILFPPTLSILEKFQAQLRVMQTAGTRIFPLLVNVWCESFRYWCEKLFKPFITVDFRQKSLVCYDVRTMHIFCDSLYFSSMKFWRITWRITVK
jgi:hypothetical protein